MSSKIIYADVSLKDFNLDAATRVKNEALPTISRLLGNISLRDSSQRPVTVSVVLDEFAYDKKIFKQAKATRLGDARYPIEIGVGLLGQPLLLESMSYAGALNVDYSVLLPVKMDVKRHLATLSSTTC
jgi:hypothetical protein